MRPIIDIRIREWNEHYVEDLGHGQLIDAVRHQWRLQVRREGSEEWETIETVLDLVDAENASQGNQKVEP